MAARYAVPLLAVVLAACGPGGTTQRAAGAPCLDEAPGESAVYATRDVAFAWQAGLPEGGEFEAARVGGDLPWFTKTGVYVRGDESVVVRVPEPQSDVVRIAGWYGPGTDGELRTDVLVEPDTECPSHWTAYPGGLRFAGRQCVRVQVEGPGEQSGSALFGLRRNCSR